MVFEVSQELMEQIVNYLAKRPWVEVNQIMQELVLLKPKEETCQPSTPEQR